MSYETGRGGEIQPPAGTALDGRRRAAREPQVPVAELTEALSAARIHARYQPVVRMADRAPLALEVLARLEHPLRGTLAPDLFIPQIEEAGLGVPLTQAVIGRAFAEWGHGRLDALDLSLALNFPLDVLLMPDALTWLDERRRQAGIAAPQITVELTESRPLTRVPELHQAVQRLRRAGYGMAIDDAGPDVRDHRPLLDLGFSMLKLDKALVQRSGEDPVLQEFLLRTIATARQAQLVIVAEGIEDADGWDRMARLGVDAAQGFLIGHPMPAAAVAAWHRDWCAAGHASHRAG